MECYLIILPTDSTVSPATISSKFELHYPVVDNSVWLVGTDLKTCDEVSKLASIGQAGHREDTGVVFRVSDYYGLASMALWEKLSVWQRNPVERL